MVIRELDALLKFTDRPSSSAVPRVGMRSELSKVMLSNRCASTNTLATRSPPPPGYGELWHPAQELASGPDIRLPVLGKTRGEVGSDIGSPVPFESGRPAPSWIVQFA